MEFNSVDEVAVDAGTARVYEHGWQSWSPTHTYPVTETSHRPVRRPSQIMSYRPGKPAPADGFQGEGLLAVDPGGRGPARLYATTDGQAEVPSIRASFVDDRVMVSADGQVETFTGSSIGKLLAEWGDTYAARVGMGHLRAAPTAWCSWYH